jgi:hypothetical protein
LIEKLGQLSNEVRHISSLAGDDTKMRFILLAFVLVLTMVTVQPIAQAESSMSLPNCIRSPEVKPSSIIFACADAGFRVEKPQWTGWGDSFAAAVGTAEVNDCTPNCAAGHTHSYPMLLVVSEKRRCSDGRSAYNKVVYAFVGRSPFPGTNLANSTQEFPCHPMP